MKAKASDWYKKIWTLDIKNMSWVENTSYEVDYLIDLCQLKGTERILDLAGMRWSLQNEAMRLSGWTSQRSTLPMPKRAHRSLGGTVKIYAQKGLQTPAE